jgi:hypothetical protein
VLDAVLFKVVFDVASEVLTSSIRTEYLDPLTGFQFRLCDEGFDWFAYFWFFPKGIHRGEARGVIDKHYEVPVAVVWVDRKRATDISVHAAKYVFSAHHCDLADYFMGLLPFKTQLTWTWGHLPVRNCHAGHKVLVRHMDDSIEVEVAKAVMLEFDGGWWHGKASHQGALKGPISIHELRGELSHICSDVVGYLHVHDVKIVV